MDRVVTFLLTTKPDEAIAFFRGKLGFTYLRDDGFALVFDMHGVMLRNGKVPCWAGSRMTLAPTWTG